MEETLDVISNLDRYDIIECTCEEYGKQTLLKLTGDQEVVDTVDGFIDWGEFGAPMMQEDGIVLTEYGMIHRVNEPTPEQTMGGIQQAQSPFL